MRITVKNWREYNPRTDVKNPSWFRLSHGLFEDPDFYDFTHAELIAWLYILSAASRKNSDTFTVNFQHVERIGRLKEKEFRSAVKKLQSLQCILVDVTPPIREGHAADTATNATNETNEHNETNERLTAPLDFEPLYRKYPRREGKSKGLATCRVQIKTPEEYAALSLAIDNYAAKVERQATEKKFIKQFSTFMHCWRDYLEPEDVPVSRAQSWLASKQNGGAA